MYGQVKKPNKNSNIANSIRQKKTKNKQGVTLIDNRKALILHNNSLQRHSIGTNAILDFALPAVLYHLTELTGTDLMLEQRAEGLKIEMGIGDKEYPADDTHEALGVVDGIMAYIRRHLPETPAQMMNFYILEHLIIEMKNGSYPGRVLTANALQDRIRELDPTYESDFGELDSNEMQPVFGHVSLSLGEANMSLAKSRAMLFGGEQQISTEVRSESSMPYDDLAANKKFIEELGGTVKFEVDATKLKDQSVPKNQLYQNIVFFFPQVQEESRGGTSKMLDMLAGFFRSAHGLLVSGGQIFMTFANQRYIKRWHVVEQAGTLFKLVKESAFNNTSFPGYEHKMTKKNQSAPSTEKDQGIAMVFRKNDR